jgi:hypothetical protein
MVFRHISKDIKDRILWLRGNGYITDDISEVFGVFLRSILVFRPGPATFLGGRVTQTRISNGFVGSEGAGSGVVVAVVAAACNPIDILECA